MVLDAPGIGGSHYTSDLVLVNRGDAATAVTLDFLAQPGVTTTESLGPGRQLRIADVMQRLRDRGARLPAGAQVGALRVTFVDATDPDLVFAGSRSVSDHIRTRNCGREVE